MDYLSRVVSIYCGVFIIYSVLLHAYEFLYCDSPRLITIYFDNLRLIEIDPLPFGVTPSLPTVGGVYSYNFLPFLLMDIVVKNSTTRDVLNAVLYPRWQILMGGVVILIIVQIYTFFLVSTTST